jgi:hypothetical protein
MTTVEQDKRTLMSAAGTRADAIDLAHLVSETTQSDMELILDSEEEVIRGPLVIASRFRKDFTPEQLNQFPEIDTWDHTDSIPKSLVGAKVANNFDWSMVDRAMPLGGVRAVKHSWYSDFAAAIGIAETLTARIDKLAERAKDKLDSDHDDTITALAQDRRRLDNIVSKVRRAVEFIQQCDRFDRMDKTVGYWVTKQQSRALDGAFLFDENKQPITEISRGPNPIKIWDKSPEGSAKGAIKFVSLTQFLAFDVQEAIDNGGTYTALLKTVQRDQQEDGGEAKAIAMKDLFGIVGRMNTLFGQDTIDKAIAREIAKPNTGGPLAHELVELAVTLNNWLPLLQPVADKWSEAAAAKRAKLLVDGADKQSPKVVQAKVL